jgi:hypothetical protein
MTTPFGLITAISEGKKANDEPRNTGTLNFVQRWKMSVPTPAVNKASDALRPVNSGTRMVAPNIANRCWMLSR